MSKIQTGALYRVGKTLHLCIRSPNHGYIKAALAGVKMGVQTGEFFLYFVEDPAGFIQERFSARWIDEQNGIQGIFGLKIDQPENPTPIALLFMRAKGWDKTKVEKWLRSHSEYQPKQLNEGRRLKKRIRKKSPPAPVKNLAADRKGIPTFGAYVTPHSVFFPDGTALDRAVVEEALKRRGRR